MRFILFVEGKTERGALAEFLRRWLDVQQLSEKVGIKPVHFKGWADLVKHSPKKANLYLAEDDVIAVIALLDLYGPTFYPKDKKTALQRYKWAKQYLENEVDQENFFQFFAVHEVEAWLLSDPSIFPRQVRSSVEKISRSPETVNTVNYPAKRLNEIYKKQINRKYDKPVYGKDLFSKLDPNIAYNKCPRLKQLLDEMLKMAKEALA